jgi:hypothetical protein
VRVSRNPKMVHLLQLWPVLIICFVLMAFLEHTSGYSAKGSVEKSLNILFNWLKNVQIHLRYF